MEELEYIKLRNLQVISYYETELRYKLETVFKPQDLSSLLPLNNFLVEREKLVSFTSDNDIIFLKSFSNLHSHSPSCNIRIHTIQPE